LLTIAVAVYFAVRSLTEGAAATARHNADLVIGLERSLGMFVERDVQRFALQFDGVQAAANTIYIWFHWPVIVGVLVWLAWRRPHAYPVYRDALLVSGLIGMVIVATFPMAPPRLTDLGFLDTVTAHSNAYRVLQPPSFTNQYAAMPSFHVGWDLLMGIALVRESNRRWVRAVGFALPSLMLVTVVVTGNHFILDAVVGDAIVLATLAAVRYVRSPDVSAAEVEALPLPRPSSPHTTPPTTPPVSPPASPPTLTPASTAAGNESRSRAA